MLFRSIWVDGSLTFEHYLTAMGETRYMGLLLRSLGIALTAAVMAVVLGVSQAFLLERTDIRARSWWRSVYLLPLCIPPHVHAISLIYLCGETGWLNKFLSGFFGVSKPVLNIYTPFWVAMILALAFHPLVTLMAHSGLRTMDRRMEEAARQYHPFAYVLRKITLPLLAPHIFAGGVFVFIFAFFNYGVPSLLRVHTYPVEIFAQFSAFYNEAAATALAMPVVLAALFLLALQRIWMRDRSYVVIDTGSAHTAVLPLGRLRYIAVPGLIMLSGAAAGLPVIVLIVQSKALETFAAVWRSASHEIIFTTLLSICAATVIVILAYLLCGSLPLREKRNSKWLDFIFYAPLAIPATVLGIGLIYTWNRPATQIIYGGVVILVIAYAARFLPLSLQAVSAGLRQVGPGLREAALLSQGSWWKRSLKIEIPLCLPALVAGWAIAFILCMSELGATLLVIPPGMGTIALKIYTLMHYGANQIVAALSIVMVSINLILAASAVLCARRWRWTASGAV